MVPACCAGGCGRRRPCASVFGFDIDAVEAADHATLLAPTRPTDRGGDNRGFRGGRGYYGGGSYGGSYCGPIRAAEGLCYPDGR